MASDADPVPDALGQQAASCEHLGSPLYATLLRGLRLDYERHGITWDLLSDRFDRPVHDAAALRLLAGLHAIALRGDAPGLAGHFPSTGGRPGSDLVEIALETMADHRDEIVASLDHPVQTNEVGRSVVLLALSHWLTRLDVPEFDLIEVGASAGLNLNFDRYGARCGPLSMGEPGSRLFFDEGWFDGALPVPRAAARAANKIGIDPDPIDPLSQEGNLRLRSFLWPDHHERRERLAAALEILHEHPTRVERGSADRWIESHAGVAPARCTLVYHSIVWQYMGAEVQDRMRDALTEWGSRTSPTSPLVWARMEPAGAVADVRATIWAGDEPTEVLLADVGYHGRGLRWTARPD